GWLLHDRRGELDVNEEVHGLIVPLLVSFSLVGNFKPLEKQLDVNQAASSS
ncbi:hypothetical protein Dimus_013070, partial [Dionaea muscipula]